MRNLETEHSCRKFAGIDSGIPTGGGGREKLGTSGAGNDRLPNLDFIAANIAFSEELSGFDSHSEAVIALGRRRHHADPEHDGAEDSPELQTRRA